MAGVRGGLQAKILDIEPRALYVHCFAHSLSLVVQDTLKHIVGCRNVLNLVKDIIVYVKHSPKRFAFFRQLQYDNDTSINLRPFCQQDGQFVMLLFIRIYAITMSLLDLCWNNLEPTNQMQRLKHMVSTYR